MLGQSRLGPLILLGLTGCPQLQNDDWVVADGSSPTQQGDDANAPDSASDGGADARAGDAGVLDAWADAPSSDDASQDGTADGSPSGDDTGPAGESGPPDSNPPDGPIAAQPLYCGLTVPRGITVANGNVCWVGDLNPRGLFCAPAAGGGPVAHVDVASDAPFLVDAFDLLFDATNVYWSNGQNNQVVTRAQSGGQPQQYFTGGGRVSFLAAGDGATLWATDFPDPSDANSSSSGEVIVGPMAGGTSSNAIYTNQQGAAGVGMFNGNVYWGAPDGISFGSVAGNAPIYHIASPEMPVAGVAVDPTGVVYFLAGNQSLYRYVTGTQTAALVYRETQALGAGDVALDGANVYFSEPDLGCIVRVPR